jgi:hypothetical protein
MNSDPSFQSADSLKRIEILIVVVIAELLIAVVFLGIISSKLGAARNEPHDAAGTVIPTPSTISSPTPGGFGGGSRYVPRPRSGGFEVEPLGMPAMSEETKFSALRGAANTNARALATAVQGKAISMGKYDSVLQDYATDLGGAIPVNPCTGTTAGYSITATATTATVMAMAGSNCGSWTPMVFTLTL